MGRSAGRAGLGPAPGGGPGPGAAVCVLLLARSRARPRRRLRPLRGRDGGDRPARARAGRAGCASAAGPRCSPTRWRSARPPDWRPRRSSRRCPARSAWSRCRRTCSPPRPSHRPPCSGCWRRVVGAVVPPVARRARLARRLAGALARAGGRARRGGPRRGDRLAGRGAGRGAAHRSARWSAAGRSGACRGCGRWRWPQWSGWSSLGWPVRQALRGWPPTDTVVVACDVGQGDALVLPTGPGPACSSTPARTSWRSTGASPAGHRRAAAGAAVAPGRRPRRRPGRRAERAARRRGRHRHASPADDRVRRPRPAGRPGRRASGPCSCPGDRRDVGGVERGGARRPTRPGPRPPRRPTTCRMVVRVTVARRRLLLTGDLGAEAEARLVASGRRPAGRRAEGAAPRQRRRRSRLPRRQRARGSR